MTVLLPNARLAVRRRNDGADDTNAYGERAGGTWDAPSEFGEGRVTERADGMFGLGVDPDLWPVSQGDLVVGDDDREWLVSTAALLRNNHDSTVDWIRCEAREHHGVGQTEPGGAQFTGR